MAKSTYEIPTEIRSDKGKGASRRLRRENKTPAILYGGTRDPLMLSIDHEFLLLATEEERFYTSLLELNADGTKQMVILRDLQRHPYKRQILHVDFQRINEKEPLHMHVPLHFIGEDKSPAGKSAGVVISHHLIELSIICLPKDLPEFIEVDLKNLEPGDIVHISDIKLPKGVELGHDMEEDNTVLKAAHIRASQGTGAAAPEEAPSAEVPTVDEAEESEEDDGEEKSED